MQRLQGYVIQILNTSTKLKAFFKNCFQDLVYLNFLVKYGFVRFVMKPLMFFSFQK